LLHSESCVGVARHGVGQPASCRMASRDASSVYSDFCVVIGTIGIRSDCVGLCWIRLDNVFFLYDVHEMNAYKASDVCPSLIV
jgi:hypothetical protein